mgnify:FL=1
MDDQKKTGPRDVFTHLLAIIFLYVNVISFGTLLFQLINIQFPDTLAGEYGMQYARTGVRWPIAILVIVFPLYIWLTSWLQKDVATNPEKRDLKTRKWLLYFTLFLTTIVIVVDLVALIYQFLGGEVTGRFLLKVLTIFIIGAVVFIYYLWNLRRDVPALKHKTMKFFVYGVIILGAGAILLGFVISGSPQTERLRRFDNQRVQDLYSIQSQLSYYWQRKETLPQSLDGLRDDLAGYLNPTDPETGKAYEYRVTGPLSFELCATFQLSNQQESVPVGRMDMGGLFNNHSAGRTCFTRTIDPELYPSLKAPLIKMQ